MKTPSFANACGQVGAEPLEGCGGRSPLQCHSSPQGVCTHSRTHTGPARAPVAGTSAWFGGAERTPHPTSGSSPAGDAPHSPPPKSHWTEGWRGAQGARSEGGRPPCLRFALQKPRQDWRGRGGWRCLARALPPAPGLRQRQLRTCPAVCVRVGLREAAGREAAVGRVQAAGAQLLTGSAGGRGGSHGSWWSCRRRHAWLPGRRCRRWKESRGGPAADLCFRGHLLSPLPPWAHPASFLTSFFTPVSSRRCSRLRPESTSSARSEGAGASHEPFVLGPFSIRSALPPGEGGSLLPRHSPGSSPATCGRLRPLVGGRGRGWRETRRPQRKAELPRPGNSWKRGPRSPRAQRVQVHVQPPPPPHPRPASA